MNSGCPDLVAPIQTGTVESCPLCGHSGHVVYQHLTDRAYSVPGDWQIICCSNCRSGWLNPVPVPKDLPRCYAAGYYTHETPPPPSMGSSKVIAFLRGAVLSVQKGYEHLRPEGHLVPAIGRLSLLIPAIRRRASFNLGEMVVPYRKGGRLLEIGCGDGSYLSLMRMLGWTVYGIEPDPMAAEVARAAGCDVHVGTIEDAQFEAESFDAVVSHHVIEHVYDQKSFVSSAGRLLTNGGVMVVQTPNFQSLGHRLFGADTFSLDPPRHLCLFTPTSLRRLFEESNIFRRVRITTPTACSRLAFRRRCAVRETGNFLAEFKPGRRSRWAESLFRAVEASGNAVFHWGEEIQCTAVKAAL